MKALQSLLIDTFALASFIDDLLYMHSRFPSILKSLHIVHGLLYDVINDLHVPAHRPILEIVVVDAHLLESA